MEKIILFYKYVAISDPHGIKRWQEKLCQDFNLKGRIIIAKEGINATLAGEGVGIKRYISIVEKHPLFINTDFKESEGSKNDFPRLSIKIRKEIVTLGREVHNFEEKTGEHKTPLEVHELLQKNPQDLVIFDARNQHEWEIGRFTNAITPPIKNFRELPEFIDKNTELFKDKQVLMYCTGGIRCEKASAYLQEKNIAKKVMQISGGIARYAEKFPDGFFRGKNYVFDGRISMHINDDVLGSCFICKKTADTYINCLNVLCNRHFICCDFCKKDFDNRCKRNCGLQKEAA